MNKTRKILATGAGALSLMMALAGCASQNEVYEKLGATDGPDKALAETEMPMGEGDALYAMDSTAEAGYAESYDCPEPYTDFNTEEYSSNEESGFISTATRPLSTVSSDVDTASYCNLRRMIEQGYALDDIPSGAVRVEEMLNYFSYDYAQPQGKDRFSITARAGACPWNEDTELLVLGFATADEPPASSGSNLVFLVDVSGSMYDRDKLPLLKDALAELVEGLDSDDRVSIVTYSGSERIVLEGASGDDKRKIMRAVDSLEAEGSTNGEAGLRMAYEVAQDNFVEGGVNRIIMCSDGDLNVGMSSESELHDFVEGKRDTGIYLSILGFGTGNYKDNKMETLADHGNGSYHYIDSLYEARRVFGERLLANLVPFADDVRIQVEFNPAQVKGYRLIGYENREMADEDFRNDEADAGDVGPGSQFTVAYEIVKADSKMDVPSSDLKYGGGDVAEASGASDDEWLTCTLRYNPIGGNGFVEQTLVVDGSAWSKDPGDDWTFASAVIEAGMAMTGSEHAGSSSIDSAIGILEGMRLDDERAGFLDLLKELKDDSGRDRGFDYPDDIVIDY